MFFWDESGFRADTVHGKTWGVRGQTPVVYRPGQRQSFSAASAVNANGRSGFAPIAARSKPICCHLAAPAHAGPAQAGASRARQSAGAQDRARARLRRFDEWPAEPAFSAGYAPDLNPDEWVWSHVKRTGAARRTLRAGETLREKIEEQLAQLKRMPHLVRSFFLAPSVAYIARLLSKGLHNDSLPGNAASPCSNIGNTWLRATSPRRSCLARTDPSTTGSIISRCDGLKANVTCTGPPPVAMSEE